MTIVKSGKEDSPELEQYADRLRSYGTRVIVQDNKVSSTNILLEFMRLSQSPALVRKLEPDSMKILLREQLFNRI
jgi:hypothetical protein